MQMFPSEWWLGACGRLPFLASGFRGKLEFGDGTTRLFNAMKPTLPNFHVFRGPHVTARKAMALLVVYVARAI